MNLLSFRYFIEVSRHLNFSKASESLHISQPGLSQQIITLEEQLGFKLLNRTTRKVTLTEEGKYLYNKLSPLFENIENTVNEVAYKKSIPEIVVKIAAVPSAASIHLPNILTQLHSELPDAKFYLQETTSVKAIELIKQQKSHLAFIRTPIDSTVLKNEGLNMLEFSKHPIQVVMPKSHVLAHKESIDLYELRMENFIHYDQHQSPSLYYLLEQACLTAGFVPTALCAGPEILTIANLISGGLGVTLMPKDIVTLLDTSKLAVASLRNQQFQSSISAIWRDSDYLPLVTQAILRLLRRTGSSSEAKKHELEVL